MVHPPIIQQSSEYLQPQSAATDVLVPVQPRRPLRLRVVAMPNTYILEPDCTVKMLQRQIAAFRSHNVVFRNVSIASIDTRTHRQSAP